MFVRTARFNYPNNTNAENSMEIVTFDTIKFIFTTSNKGRTGELASSAAKRATVGGNFRCGTDANWWKILPNSPPPSSRWG